MVRSQLEYRSAWFMVYMAHKKANPKDARYKNLDGMAGSLLSLIHTRNN